MKAILSRLSCLLLILALSCQPEKPESLDRINEKGLATPIWLKHGSTTVELSDYFFDIGQIDSIGHNANYTIEMQGDQCKITVSEKCKAAENLRVYHKGIRTDIPLYRSRKKAIDITCEEVANTAALKGSFTNWVITPMQKQDNDWNYNFYVEPGEHQYLLIVDGKEMLDPRNPDKVSNGMGGFNSLLRVKDESDKAPFIISESYNKNELVINCSNYPESFLIYDGNLLLAKDRYNYQDGKLRIDCARLMDKTLRVLAMNDYGRSNFLRIPIRDGKPVSQATDLSRKDMHGSVFYFLMVDRFRSGDSTNNFKVDDPEIQPIANYFGGDLQGVLDKIEDGYFESLGINTIWLSPITQNPEGAYGFWPNPPSKFSGYHGYWPISNTQVDYRFGDEDLMKKLLDEAHKRDINVILDYVANHVHEEHPLYKENKDWATNLYLPDSSLNTEKWDEHRLTTWFDTFMPTLDFSKPEVVDRMTDSALYWVTHYDLDGFRHDATKHIQESFWRTLTHKIKSERNDIFQIGETYGSYELIQSYISTGMLDGQFDFNMYDAAVWTFAGGESFGRLKSNLEQSLNYFGQHHLMGNITGNQDRARFISYASGDVKFSEDAKFAGWTRDIVLSDSSAYDKLEMLHAYNLSIPGIPVVYYADEYGEPGANDPDNRRWMRFDGLSDKELDLREKVSQMIKLRRSNLALQYGTTEVSLIEDKVLHITRSYLGETVDIVFNHNDSNKSVILSDKTSRVSLNKNSAKADGDQLEITIPANSYDIIY